MSKKKIALLLLGLFLLTFGVGCKKKAPAPPPPPPPAAPPPPEAKPLPSIVTFTVEPSTVEKGKSATLRWDTSNTSEVSIDKGIGTVPADGSRQIFPTDTTTYTLTAKNADGKTATRSATVTVRTPPPPPPPKPPEVTSLTEYVGRLQDAYFDFDKSDIREDARAALTRDADILKQIFNDYPNAVIAIEGNCDERGSAEYNLGLGDRRATSAKDFLTQLGVPADKLRTISYGEERPVCTESTEECWQRNRHDHFSIGQ
jgi:peptidoglycan-associated lipoprotein